MKKFVYAVLISSTFYGSAALSAEEILAKFSGGSVTKTQVENYFQMVNKSSPMGKENITFNQLPDDAKKHLIETVALGQYILHKAEKAGLDKKPEVKEQLQFAHDQVLQHDYLMDKINALITEKELKQAYKDMEDSYKDKYTYTLRQIVTKNDKEAQDAYNELKKGAKFDEVAKKFSTHPSKDKGGEMGKFNSGELLPQFENAVKNLKPGGYTEPIKTGFGFYILELEEKRPARLPPFAEMKDKLRPELEQKFIPKVIDNIKNEAKIELVK
jgi:peptidyl-prolyl cis-trans isomerase C